MANQPHTGFRRLLKATGYSWQGAWRNEAVIRPETLLCLGLIPGGLWLGGNGVERVLLVVSLLLVVIVEG